MNNNNRNNNRRRGRNNRGGQGGSNQGNRIDSRARGNAPQMLEKNKKLAHDASLNGDRVQTEYYLQFADHYFRVIADSRAQRDEQPPQNRARGNDRDQDDYGSDYENEFEGASNRNERERGGYRDNDEQDEGQRASEGEEASQAEDDNPFVRQNQPRRAEGRESRGNRNGRANGGHRPEERDEESFAGLDPASLPPAIGAETADDEEAPRPRRRTRKPRPAGDDETLETVN